MQLFRTQWLSLVRDLKDADIHFVFGCISYKQARDFSKKVLDDILANRKPGAKVYMTDCYGKLSSAHSEHENVFYLDGNWEDKMSSILNLNMRRTFMTFYDDTIALVIGEGCQRKCGYCKTNLANFSLRSVPFSEIEFMLKRGTKYKPNASNIIIDSMNNSQYGRDLDEGKGIYDVINLAASYEQVKGIYVPTIQPADVRQELISTVGPKSPVREIGLIMETTDDWFLDKSKRGYKTKDVQDIIDAFYARNKDLHIRTGIMVGIPGDNEQTVRDNIHFIDKNKLSFSVSVYSHDEKLPIDEYRDLIPNRGTTMKLLSMYTNYQKQSKRF